MMNTIELEALIELMRPFCFIKDIQDIQQKFEQLTHEKDAIELRKKLRSLVQKPYYAQLNQRTLDIIIYQALLFLAQHYPINEEDPISLETLHSNNSVVISSGHRFDKKSIGLYLAHHNLFNLKNPYTNQTLDRRDTVRLLNNTEITSQAFQNNKTSFLLLQSYKDVLLNLPNKTDEELSEWIEQYYFSKKCLYPLFYTALIHFCLLNYFLIVHPIHIPKIEPVEEVSLILVNLLSLFFNHKILEKMILPSINPNPEFYQQLSQILGMLIRYLGVDICIYFIKRFFGTHQTDSSIESLNCFFIAYACYHMALKIQYPFLKNPASMMIDFFLPEITYLVSSNFLINLNHHFLGTSNDFSPENELFLANHWFYMPASIGLYLYIHLIMNVLSYMNHLHPEVDENFNQEMGEFFMNVNI